MRPLALFAACLIGAGMWWAIIFYPIELAAVLAIGALVLWIGGTAHVYVSELAASEGGES